MALREGGVTVEGPLLGAQGVALAAGHLLRVREDAGTVALAPLAAAPVTTTSPPATGAGPPPQRAAPRPPESWRALAGDGRYAAALEAAERSGFASLCARLDAAALLALGDTARYAGSRERARQAYRCIVDRFAGDAPAADALFSLGRLESESGHPVEAGRWFERYLREWPSGPLANEASGRALECRRDAGDQAGARAAAASYLERHPRGAHAALAREVLAESARR